MQPARRRGISAISSGLLSAHGLSTCRSLLTRSVSLITAIAITSLSWAGDTVVTTEKTKVTKARIGVDGLPEDISIELFGRVPRQRLTLNEAIQMGLANNLDAKFENRGIGIERGRVRFAAGAFDPVFSINTAGQSLRRLENVNDVRSADVVRQNQAIASNIALSQQLFDQNNINLIALGQTPRPETERPTISRELGTTNFSSTTFDAQSFQLESGVVGRTPWGMRYGVQASGQRVRNTFSGDTREIIPEYVTEATLTIVQPLLRGFGTNVNLADLRIARVNHQIQVLEWKDRVSATVQGVMAAYIDMAYALREVRVREEAVSAGQKLVDLYRRRVELGFNSPIDIRQAEVQVSSDRELLIVAKNVFLERQFALKRLILAEYDRDTPVLYIPVETPRLPSPELNRTTWLKLAYERRYDYRQALLTANAQDVRLAVAKNQLLPQLDLVASYGLNGLGTTIGDSIDQGVEGRTPTWSVGVNFSIPLGNVQPRANLAIARGLKEQALIRIKQAEVTVGTDVDQILSRIVLSQQRVATAIQTRQVAEELERIGYRRLEEGLVSSFDIIDIQRRLYEAKTRELAAQAEYNRSVTLLWLASATVVDKMGISFVEPRKPY